MEVGRHAMEVTYKSKTEGIIIMPITVSDSPEPGGVKPTSERSKERPRWTASTIARTATKRAIRTNPDSDPIEPNKQISSDRTTRSSPEEPKTDRARLLRTQTRD